MTRCGCPNCAYPDCGCEKMKRNIRVTLEENGRTFYRWAFESSYVAARDWIKGQYPDCWIIDICG